MHLPRARRERDRQAQECGPLQGRAEQSIERLAAGILKHQHGPAALTQSTRADAPPTPHPARPSVHIREQDDRGWQVSGCSAAGSTASTEPSALA